MTSTAQDTYSALCALRNGVRDGAIQPPDKKSRKDRRSDATRLQGIKRAISEAVVEAERERDGFRRRYEDASVNAAFLFENMENEGETEKASAQVDDLTQALTRFSQRIDFLEKQMAFMQEMDEAITNFENANGIGQVGPESDQTR